MIRRAVCVALGHKWVFSHITLPRRMFCATCGKRANQQGNAE